MTMKHENRFLSYMEKCLFDSLKLKGLIKWTHDTQTRLLLVDTFLLLSLVPYTLLYDSRTKEILYRCTFSLLALRCFYHAGVLFFVTKQYLSDMKSVMESKRRQHYTTSPAVEKEIENIKKRIPGIKRTRKSFLVGTLGVGFSFLFPVFGGYGFLLFSFVLPLGTTVWSLNSLLVTVNRAKSYRKRKKKERDSKSKAITKDRTTSY